jgi:hypothetical protein
MAGWHRAAQLIRPQFALGAVADCNSVAAHDLSHLRRVRS